MKAYFGKNEHLFGKEMNLPKFCRKLLGFAEKSRNFFFQNVHHGL